ncbi:uncharacterized protein LOC129959396 [Argiope bruennichi]|uniref:uncharacterized protein LOC129959396 n=1 Tax=Argiope bruennichi TaxID=94029 RepID=UPI0024940D27|nr:uncharacterized protein LOC129959396 [Argiope bruennichi]
MQATCETPKYIMPHHGVFRPESSTTKLRVVFNASEATSSGQSLNDNLYSGSVVQDDLFAILLRFRKHSIVFTADIKKMYRQIWIHPDQCDLQCILWKDLEDEKLRVFKLLTVTYGTKCAPYLATRVLKQICCDEQDNYPLAAAAGKDFYVDDILSGTEDLSSAIELQNQLIHLLKSAGMELHKWSSNNPVLLQKVPTSDREYNFDNPNSTTLGLQFNPENDKFSLLGPLIITAKMFLQKLWILRIDWDDEVPLHLNREWEKFSSELSQLKNVNIDRHVLCSKVLKVDLIGFGYASKNADGCAVYTRSLSRSGEIKVSLLCSKSRVAPNKEISIPRLELCAADLLSKLIVKVLSSLQLDIDGVHLYSDSTVVLAWIKTPPTSLKTFVANRVARIQEYTKNFQWHYVNTAENPADLISRGVFPSKIQQLDIWWNGPSFLSSSSCPNFNDDPGVADGEYLLENLKGAAKTTGPLNAEELNYAETFLIKNVQIQEFAKDVSSLQKHHCVPPGSKLKTLNPFLDSKGLLRVGGRLAQPIAPTQIMGNLPKERVSPDFAFNCAGADFCGPFYIKNKAQRKATLKRFMARRGKCVKLFSDNAKNFVGANREIKKLYEMVREPDEKLTGYLAAEGIEWKFIPPRSPHFGGLWEAAIKSFKYHLKRVVKGINLTYEEFLTVIVQIEGILNSRPLCPLSANEDDFEVLTPAHFLVNRSLTSLNEPDLTNLKESHLKRWQKHCNLLKPWGFKVGTSTSLLPASAEAQSVPDSIILAFPSLLEAHAGRHWAEEMRGASGSEWTGDVRAGSGSEWTGDVRAGSGSEWTGDVRAGSGSKWTGDVRAEWTGDVRAGSGSEWVGRVHATTVRLHVGREETAAGRNGGTTVGGTGGKAGRVGGTGGEAGRERGTGGESRREEEAVEIAQAETDGRAKGQAAGCLDQDDKNEDCLEEDNAGNSVESKMNLGAIDRHF